MPLLKRVSSTNNSTHIFFPLLNSHFLIKTTNYASNVKYTVVVFYSSLKMISINLGNYN